MRDVFTSKQAAEYLGYSEFTLSMSRSTGKLGGTSAPKYIKAGKAVRYRAEDLSEWLAQFEVRTETEKNG